MENNRTYYQVLHVQPDAPMAVIRESHRALLHALWLHPTFGNDREEAATINEAFAILNDPEKRRAYDKMLNGTTELSPAPEPSKTETDEVAAVPVKVQEDAKPGVWRSCAFCRTSHPVQVVEQSDAICDQCHSPLFQAVRHEDFSSTRRALDRVRHRMPVICWEAGCPDISLEMTSVDVSVNGMRLSSPHHLFPGQRLRIQCSFCDAVGLVTYVAVESADRQDRWHIGVQFLTLNIRQARGVFLSVQA